MLEPALYNSDKVLCLRRNYKDKMQNYKLIKNDETLIGIWRIDTQQGIPIAEDNTDYQEYLEWVAEGNTAEPANE